MLSRPKAVVVVSAFLFAATLMATVVGIELVFPIRQLDWIWKWNPGAASVFHSAPGVFGGLLLAFGAATFVAARNLLRRRIWAWWFAVALFSVDILGNVVTYFLTGDWLKAIAGIAVSSLFLTLLVRSPVRKYCRAIRAI